MKKVLILSNSSGGLYSFRRELIEEMMNGGMEVYISTPRGDKADLLEQLGAIFVDTPIDRRGINPVKDLQLFMTYLKLLKKLNPDMVLAYTVKPNIYGSIACRLTNKPYLNTITGLGSAFIHSGWMSRLLITMYKIAFKKSKMVFFQNSDNMDYMLRQGTITGPRKLIPGSGVNLGRFDFNSFPEEKDIVFNYVGRIMKDKGIDDYLIAAKIIKHKYPETTFNIIGSVESSQPHYEQVIAERERDGIVNYLGYQKDVKPLLISSHCIIHPSRGGEGMSNVLLESAAIGRCLIAADIPGCREIIDDGRNGYTFQAGNSDDLIEKIERFVGLPHEEKAEMGRRGRGKVEREFDRQIVVNNYLEEIHTVFLNSEEDVDGEEFVNKQL